MPHDLVSAIQQKARALNEPRDLTPLIERLSQARIVMLGESSHGTHEFYHWRRIISEWLMTKHGFNFIAVEGDWPACWNLNRFAHGEGPKSAREVLRSFDRWPTWMWANTDVVRLADWMRTHNQTLPADQQVGFYGLDVYSLFDSIHALLTQLERINPFLARRARLRYACFDPFDRNEKAYAKSLIEFPEGCEREVLDTLHDLLQLRLDGMGERELALFDAQQNARVIANAENYYRTMIHGNEDSWNVRDRHMMETLEVLLKRAGPNSRAIVWAHNTHIGDYRATSMAAEGQVNLGGLAREHFGADQVALVGFGTNSGEVTASHAWDGPIEVMPIPTGRKESVEAAMHAVSSQMESPAFFLTDLDDPIVRAGELGKVYGHRAIGVVYHPAYEHYGNYVPTRLANRYDAFLFVDRTTPLTPLIQEFEHEEIPETWPQGQ